jgi:lysophospholipase L1-like esterase
VVAALSGCGSAGAASSSPPPSTAAAPPAATSSPATYGTVVALVAEAVANKPAPLIALFRGLERLEREEGGPLRIVQLGDSHTAGDVFSGVLRQRLQERFGDGGRGTMAAGLPYNGVRQVEVHVSETGHWTYHNSLVHPDETTYGVTGFVAESRSAGAALLLETKDPAGFDQVEVEVLSQPKGGALDIEVDDKRLRRVNTDGTHHLGRITLSVPVGSHALRLTAVDRRPVQIVAWTIERRAPGVVLDALGISGATVGVISRWSPDFVADELKHRNPALVILEYGTNEAFKNDFELGKYEQVFADSLAAIRRAAPGAAILVVGPPDAQRLTPSCLTIKGSGAQATCLPQESSTRPGSCAWAPPPPLAEVRELERRQSAQAGLAFWDWSAAMGGPCSMHQWVQSDPPLGRGDHVHMTLAGYTLSADALFHELMSAYDAYRAAEASRPAPKKTRP